MWRVDGSWYDRIMMDPNEIRFTRRSERLERVLDLPTHEDLPPVTVEAMTAMVELLLVNGPVPHVVLHERLDETVAFGAGNAFVSACRTFRDGAKLGTTQFMAAWAGRGLTDLEPYLQRRFRQRNIELLTIEPGTSPTVARTVFAALARGTA